MFKCTMYGPCVMWRATWIYKERAQYGHCSPKVKVNLAHVGAIHWLAIAACSSLLLRVKEHSQCTNPNKGLDSANKFFRVFFLLFF